MPPELLQLRLIHGWYKLLMNGQRQNCNVARFNSIGLHHQFTFHFRSRRHVVIIVITPKQSNTKT